MNMGSMAKPFRASVLLPPKVASRVRQLARSKGTTTSRVLGKLIERGIEEERFFEVGRRLQESKDPSEQKRLKAELARLTFGC